MFATLYFIANTIPDIRTNTHKTIEATLPFEALFFEKEQIFSSDIESSIKINGNSEQIKQVIDILLDNAINMQQKTHGLILL